MDIATAYIPMDRRQALAAKENLTERTQGAVLFADISGFTPLTEALARELGPKRGAEELTVHLNRVYDALITELHRLSGSVISFSGDAITCWFDKDDGRRATACGLAMQATMGQFAEVRTHSGGIVSMGMKAAVALGAVRRFVVGLPEHKLVDTMAGHTLESVAAAEHQAERGDVILDNAAATALEQHLDISVWRIDEQTGERFAVVTGLNLDVPEQEWPVWSEDTLPETERAAWVLPAVYQRLSHGGGDFLAELRTAAALFMRFGGIEYDDDEEAPQKLDALIQQVQRILIRYDGNLLQLTIGDKGSYLYAAFGAPISHEDNVDRALATALELQALSQQFDYLPPPQIGVTYGRMRVGAYGGTARRTYGVLGDAVNLSARLMSAALPGQILVSDEAVVRANEGSFVWETLPAIKVKGKSEPVSLQQLVRANRRQTSQALESKFPETPVGRDDILQRMEGLLDDLHSGQGQTVHLSAEAGMGKSHLMAHLSRRAAAQGFQLALGRCQSISRNVPYAPWRQIFHFMLGLADNNDAEAVTQALQYLETEHPDWVLRLPLLGDLLGLPIPDNPTTAALDSDLRQQSLYSLLVEMVQVWSQTLPLLLIIENAHWMDEASVSLAQILVQQVVSQTPTLLLLPSRPPQLGEADPLIDLRELTQTTTLNMTEMSDPDILTLMEYKLAAPPSPLLESVVQRLSRGNPFFVLELLDAMRRGRQVTRDETGTWLVAGELLATLRRADFVVQSAGRWLLRPEADLSAVKLGLPDSIHGLILSRLDRLPEEHKLTLKVSSVIGYTFDLALLADAHPEQKDVAEIEAEALFMDAEQVLREEEPARKFYAFRHHSAQEVAYETLLYTQRQRLHRAVAEALVELQPEAVAQIAHHAFAGELWPLALQYNLLAGEQARQLHALQQSVDFFQKALQSARALPDEETAVQRKHIHLALGELHVASGQYDQATEHLQATLVLAQDQNDREAEARSNRFLGRAHEQQGQYAVALTWLEKGFAALNGQVSLEEAELSLFEGLISLRQGNYNRAQELCQRSLQVGQTLNDAAIRARTYNLMGISDLRHNPELAVERFNQALSVYCDLGNVYGQATCQNLIANGQFAVGELTTADSHYRLSLDLFTQIGHMYNQVLGNNNLGGIAIKQGRLDAALGHYQRAVRLLQQTGGSLWVFGALHLNMGNAYLHRRELDAAAAELQLSQSYFDQAQARDWLPELLGLFAELSWQQGDLDMAADYGRQSVDLARELTMPREEGHNLRILGEIARARQDLQQAETTFLQSYEILAQAGDQYEQAKTQLSLAELYVAQDAGEQAQASLTICAEIFDRLGAAPDLAKARALQDRIANPASS